MKKLLLISAVALFGVANVQAEEPTQLPNVQDVHIDHDSWSYVQEQFGSLLQDQTGLNNKLGKFMQDYAHLLSVSPSLCIGLISAAFVDGACKSLDGNLPLSLATLIASGFISFAIAHKLTHIFGRFLEAKLAACELSLKRFLKQWPEHKLQTPQSLQPIFDVLYQDLEKNRDKFTAISQEEIQKLVEAVLAISLVVSTIR